MISPARPVDAGRLGRIWNVLYDFGYGLLRALTLLLFRPLFLVRLVGAPPALPRGGVLLCANHGSYLDPAFVQLLIGRRIVFVMTNEFYRLPAGRWFFRAAGAIPVGRGRLARAGLERAIALLRRGQAVGIFPEGRLSLDGTIGPAQRGVAILARMGQAPVVPLGIAGNMRAWPRGAPWLRRADVRIAFGPLIAAPPAHPSQGRGEEQAFADAVIAGVRQAHDRANLHGR